MGGVVASFGFRVNMIERKIVGGTTIDTSVVPMFFDRGSPHTLSFACGHGPEKEKVFRRIFERHGAYYGGLLLFGETCFHSSVCLRRHRAFAFWATGACLATLVDVGVEARLGFAFHFFRGLFPWPFLARFLDGDSNTIRPSRV